MGMITFFWTAAASLRDAAFSLVLLRTVKRKRRREDLPLQSKISADGAARSHVTSLQRLLGFR